jgi:hypothetical protein
MNESATLEADLLYEVRDGIGRITFNRPQARNSLTFSMYERLVEICESARKDAALKVLILTGAGDKAFASGTDINQFRAFKTPDDAIGYEKGSIGYWARSSSARSRLLRQSTAFAPVAAPELPRAATSASAPRPRNSDFRSRARLAIVCRRPTSAGSRH